MRGYFKILILGLLLFFIIPMLVFAQEEGEEQEQEYQLEERTPGEPMTVDRIGAIIGIFDAEAERTGNAFAFKINIKGVEMAVQVITDPEADRMRIVVPIVMETSVAGARMKRVMQANFDSALDSRYAIAQGVLWATFIHPLSSLSDQEFLSGISQTLNLVTTYGSTYSSGLFVFGGGDSQGILEDLLEEYRRKLEPEI